MKLSFALWLNFAICLNFASAQTSPFPTTLDSNATLGVPADNVSSALTSPMLIGDTVAQVANAVNIPQWSLITWGAGAGAEVDKVCLVSGNTLTFGTSTTCPSIAGRGLSGTTVAAHNIGAIGYLNTNSWYHKAVASAVEAIETTLGAGFTLPVVQTSALGRLHWWTQIRGYSVGTNPNGIAFDGQNMWIENENGGNVTKLLASTGALVGTYAVGRYPNGILFDGTNIWVANADDNTVTKLLASTGALIGTYTVGTYPTGLAFDGVNVWVINAFSNNVSKVQASTGSVVGTYATGNFPEGICFDGTNIWVLNTNDQTVTKFLASSGAVVGTYTYGAGLAAVAIVFDGQSLWIPGSQGGVDYLVRLGASTGAVIAAYTINASATSPQAIVWDGFSLWVAETNANQVFRVSGVSGIVTGIFTVATDPDALAFDGQNIWVTNTNSNSVSEISPMPGVLAGACGADMQITFNQLGVCGASPNLQYDYTNNLFKFSGSMYLSKNNGTELLFGVPGAIKWYWGNLSSNDFYITNATSGVNVIQMMHTGALLMSFGPGATGLGVVHMAAGNPGVLSSGAVNLAAPAEATGLLPDVNLPTQIGAATYCASTGVKSITVEAKGRVTAVACN